MLPAATPVSRTAAVPRPRLVLASAVFASVTVSVAFWLPSMETVPVASPAIANSNACANFAAAIEDLLI